MEIALIKMLMNYKAINEGYAVRQEGHKCYNLIVLWTF
jgi:hypothetical protein